MASSSLLPTKIIKKSKPRVFKYDKNTSKLVNYETDDVIETSTSITDMNEDIHNLPKFPKHFHNKNIENYILFKEIDDIKELMNICQTCIEEYIINNGKTGILYIHLDHKDFSLNVQSYVEQELKSIGYNAQCLYNDNTKCYETITITFGKN